ncbi:MAG: type VI secretion protein IcmF/TssM N-terminal domain-containing protein, partial [Desulfobacula sp.]
EEAYSGTSVDKDTYDQKEAEAQWKESIAKLKKSHLRKYGNPLYVLPWFIIMGESRSGKTSAIKNSNLSSALTDVSKTTIISGTKNCDWWFLDQAIVLDTAGRYTIPIEEDKDKKEWQSFLSLLSKYRKKEPVNGVIVTVASDTLLNEDPSELSDKAKSIRQRINQMMRILGARFPVYVLVTKMDLVNGFTDFCDHIPEQRKDQVMGYTNTDDKAGGLAVLEHCMATVSDQIRNLRSIFIHNRINAFAVSFANEFINLKPGLESYIQSLFGDDIYQATPLFRGIYFSSACRKGKPASEFLETTGIHYNNENSPDQNTGFFLRSFFSAVLPKDRNIFAPLSEFLMWRKTTLSLGIVSLTLLCLAMSGILAFSYFNNVKALNSFDPVFFKSQPVAPAINEKILLFDRQRFEIDKLETRNDNWILPRLGLNQSRLFEKRLKQAFVNDVKKNLFGPMDDLFFEKIKTTHSMTPDEDIVARAVYTIQRIAVLQQSIEGKSFSNQKDFEKSIGNIFPSLDPGLSKAVSTKFTDIYFAYLTWKEDSADEITTLDQFRNALSQLAINTDNFNWLLSQWICSTPGIDISSFLKGYPIASPHPDSRSMVKGAFTQAGREEIKQFIRMIQKAFTNQEAFSKMEDKFWAWYAKEFYRAWFDFSTLFPSGRSWGSLVENWTDLGTLMTTDQNPYFLLLKKMGDELESFKSQVDLEPSWAKTVITLKKIKSLAETEVKKEEGSLLAKLELTKEKITDKFEKSSEKVYEPVNPKDDDALDYKMKFAEVWNEYVNSLKTMSAATSYNEKCFHMFADYFKVLSDPSKQPEPFNLTHDSLIKIDSFLKQNETSPVIQGLIRGPFDYLTTYGVHQSVVYLQDKWESIVLSAAYSTDPDKYHTTMFDKTSGLIWRFVNEEAAAFIDQNKSGYLSKTAFGLQLPFNSEFFKLLNKGEQLTLEKQDEYSVSITTLPVGVNPGATIRPFSNTLAMECADKKTELININFPETQKFNWRPGVCGDVILEIKFEEYRLQKKYRGRLGFAHFLKDFQDGTKIFNGSDFPEYAGYLTNGKVTEITVSYDINGIEPVLNFIDRRPPAIPDVIFTTFKQASGKYPTGKKIVEKEDEKPEIAPVKPVLKNKYAVKIDTLPMEVNASAQIKPVASVLQMKCKNNMIRFENNNYPQSVDFEWEPAVCGKVLLTIQFPEITLLKEYQDFLEFAKDFNYHSRTFLSDEFLEQKQALFKKGITSVTLSYDFKGDLPLFETRIDKKSNKPSAKPDSENSGVLGKDWIQKQEPSFYTLHLMLESDKEKILAFAKKNNLTDNIAVYESQLNNQKRYNLIFGSFPNFETAQKALKGLPQDALQHSPWIRQFVSVNKEIL